jgi:hypothetical protein
MRDQNKNKQKESIITHNTNLKYQRRTKHIRAKTFAGYRKTYSIKYHTPLFEKSNYKSIYL